MAWHSGQCSNQPARSAGAWNPAWKPSGGTRGGAIQEEGIVCLICREVFRQLTNSHFRSHGTTLLEYKQRFGYNLRRPLMCGTLLRLYAERAIRSRLADRIRCRPIVSDPELRRRGGYRPIALEEILNRREIRLAHRSNGAGRDG